MVIYVKTRPVPIQTVDRVDFEAMGNILYGATTTLLLLQYVRYASVHIIHSDYIQALISSMQVPSCYIMLVVNDDKVS